MMLRRKLWDLSWAVVFLVSFFVSVAVGRPTVDSVQDANDSAKNELSTNTNSPASAIRIAVSIDKNPEETSTIGAVPTNAPRDVKNVTPVIRDSIKMVASQLLHTTKSPEEKAPTDDIRTPPKVKVQTVIKTKTKPKIELDVIENSHAGVAVPVSVDELEKGVYSHDPPKESSTSNEGISTWILLNNPSSTTKIPKDEIQFDMSSSSDPPKKVKPNNQKNKPKKPSNNLNKNNVSKRPIIASTNKSDLVAGGSVMNENMFNKIKATVLANVQKNKNAANNRTTTTTTTPIPTTFVASTTTLSIKKESTTKTHTTTPTLVSAVPVKSTKTKKKKKNKNKHKGQLSAEDKISASLPIEAKEQEIELEISTPPVTTKKPKRTTTKRKKNKTKSRKPSKTSIKAEASEISETKISNNTKASKPAKTNPISTQIYNYLSREVMPTVGVGIVGLAGLVGLASYFLYPFAAPVRRVFEVDKKDDLYRHNAEEYAHDGNGQAEEEMLGTVLAGMPHKTNRINPINPYAGQTPVRPQSKNEQDQNIRYRHVTAHSDVNSYNTHYSQSKTGLAHGVVYSDPGYSGQYDTKNTYKPERKQTVYTKEHQPSYSSYSQMEPQNYSPVEPIYAASQSGPSGPTSFGSETSNTVVYGVKPTQESNFEPVYPFEGQVFSETTSFPMTYPPTSMYLGSNNESENTKDSSYDSEQSNNENKEPQFVVGNIPEELMQTATPAVVPEHGPRNIRKKRGLSQTLEEVLKNIQAESNDTFISNEIDEALGVTPKGNDIPSTVKTDVVTQKEQNIQFISDTQTQLGVTTKATTLSHSPDDYTMLSSPYPIENIKSAQEQHNTSETKQPPLLPEIENVNSGVVESVSTIPIDKNEDTKPATSPVYKKPELELTTKSFRVYEVFPINSNIYNQESSIKSEPITDTDNTLLTTSEVPYSSTAGILFEMSTSTSTESSKTDKPQKNITQSVNNLGDITYPKTSIFKFIRDLFEFKYRLGMSVLQATSDTLNRYLRNNMDRTLQKMAEGSQGR